MATKRITISVPVEIASQIRRAAGRRSISEWVASSVARTLEEDDLKRQFLEFCDSIRATPAEERRAQASFDRITRAEPNRPARKAQSRGRSAA